MSTRYNGNVRVENNQKTYRIRYVPNVIETIKTDFNVNLDLIWNKQGT